MSRIVRYMKSPPRRIPNNSRCQLFKAPGAPDFGHGRVDFTRPETLICGEVAGSASRVVVPHS